MMRVAYPSGKRDPSHQLNPQFLQRQATFPPNNRVRRQPLPERFALGAPSVNCGALSERKFGVGSELGFAAHERATYPLAQDNSQCGRPASGALDNRAPLNQIGRAAKDAQSSQIAKGASNPCAAKWDDRDAPRCLGTSAATVTIGSIGILNGPKNGPAVDFRSTHCQLERPN